MPTIQLIDIIRRSSENVIREYHDQAQAEADQDRRIVRGDGPFAPEELALAGVKVVFYLADPADVGVLRACHDSELLVVAADERALSKAPETVAGFDRGLRAGGVWSTITTSSSVSPPSTASQAPRSGSLWSCPTRTETPILDPRRRARLSTLVPSDRRAGDKE